MVVARPGANIAADIIKCQTTTPLRGDYAAAFTDAQWARLQAAFPQGVCDWSLPGLEQQGLRSTWLTIPAIGEVALTNCGNQAADEPCIPEMDASVVPDVINLRTTAGVVAAVLSTEDGSNLTGWSVSNVRLAGAAAVSGALSADGRSYVATFQKSSLTGLPAGNAVNVPVTGTLQKNGSQGQFAASTVVRVVK